METAAFAESNYALGHSAHALARLNQQGQIFTAFRRLFFLADCRAKGPVTFTATSVTQSFTGRLSSNTFIDSPALRLEEAFISIFKKTWPSTSDCG